MISDYSKNSSFWERTICAWWSRQKGLYEKINDFELWRSREILNGLVGKQFAQKSLYLAYNLLQKLASDHSGCFGHESCNVSFIVNNSFLTPYLGGNRNNDQVDILMYFLWRT